MSLEKIVKSSFRAAGCALFLAGCVPKHSAELQQYPLIETLETIPRRSYNPLTWNGAAATGLSNPARASPRLLSDYHEVVFHLPYNTTVRALVRDAGEEAPLLVGSFGFIADKRAHPPANFMRAARGHLDDYTLVIIDHPTSAPFILDNKEPSWGGIEEGWILVEIVKQLQEQYHPSSTHLVGVSMGGLGVIHAAYRGHGIIDSVLAFSPVTDPNVVMGRVFRALGSEEIYGKRLWDWPTFSNYLGLHGFFGLNGLIAGYLSILREDSRFDHVDFKTLGKFYHDTQRYKNQDFVKEIYAPYWDNNVLPHEIPDSIEAYVSDCDPVHIAAQIKTPTYIIQALDDPAVPADQFYRFLWAAGENENIIGTIYRNGGHNGFSAAFGKSWVGKTMRTYFASSTATAHH